MEVTNGDVRVDLPETLAKLLIETQDWEKARGQRKQPADPDEEAIPMTRIPGVVDISMNRIKRLVGDGSIPHVVQDRMKLVKPSDVKAYLDGLQ